MILGEQNRSVDADRFVAGLTNAMRSVVRVVIGEGGSVGNCTGWMLTRRLAVVPNHVLIPGERITVQGMERGRVKWSVPATGEPEQLGGSRYSHPSATGLSLGVALVQLKQPKRVPRLQLGRCAARSGALISVLSYPRGEPYLYLSPGTVRTAAAPFVSYDADTEAGSGGAPVFDSEWCVIGVHLLGMDRVTNSAIDQSAILEMLQESRHWPEIAAFHRLANVATAEKILQRETIAASTPASPQAVLLRAALTVNFPPEQFSKEERAALEDKVMDPRAKRWTLQPSIRRRALTSVSGGLEELRAHAPKRPASKGDRVIRRILSGPPYSLAKMDEESLSWWIQAAGWFAGVVEGLPTPDQVTRELERRRIRSRLEAIAGPEFEGRTKELGELGRWFNGDPSKPFSLTGIGGVGKSALVARFVCELPDDTLLLWLDFDRADLAPDDAVSVLAALGRQASVQLDNFTPPPAKPETWEADAEALGQALAERSLSHPPLLVLDSFEAAQYTERYQELWPVLAKIRKHLPALRVIVSGRAPVESLQGLVLRGLEEDDARVWLEKHSIRNSSVVERVLKLTGCLPLNLHLAYHFIERGGKVQDLPEHLPLDLVAGFLYGRILDRVQSVELKPVAEAALALRRLTADMVSELLGGDLVPLPPGPASAWFGELSREAALVEGSEVLKLRSEVRTAALKLLTEAKPDLVRTVDERAAAWYAKQDRADPEMAAELVYHRLRLGDVKGAEEAWIDGCGPLLQYEEENLTGEARQWLEGRKGSGAPPETSAEVWEQNAAERIRDAHRRGHDRAAKGVFAERSERTNNSPLVFLEACAMRGAGKNAEALEHLEKAGPGQGKVFRERGVLRGLLLAEADRKYEADVLLSVVEQSEWKDRPEAELEKLLVLAGRLRVATDIDAELEVMGLLSTQDGFLGAANKYAFLRDRISPIDIVLPALGRIFALNSPDYVVTVTVPGLVNSREPFVIEIEKYRSRTVQAEPYELITQRQRVMRGEEVEPEKLSRFVPAAMARVLECGWRRWAIATGSADFWRLFAPVMRTPTPIDFAIAGSAALFSTFTHLKLVAPTGLVEKVLSSTFARMVDPSSGLPPKTLSPAVDKALKEGIIGKTGFTGEEFSTLAARAHILAPHPLAVLVDRLSGKET